MSLVANNESNNEEQEEEEGGGGGEEEEGKPLAPNQDPEEIFQNPSCLVSSKVGVAQRPSGEQKTLWFQKRKKTRFYAVKKHEKTNSTRNRAKS